MFSHDCNAPSQKTLGSFDRGHSTSVGHFLLFWKKLAYGTITGKMNKTWGVTDARMLSLTSFPHLQQHNQIQSCVFKQFKGSIFSIEESLE